MPRDGLIYWGDPIVDMRDAETRAGAYMPTPEPVSMRNCRTGVYYQHRTGEIALKVKLRGIGDASAYGSNAALPWVIAMASGMAYAASSAGNTDAVDAGVDANTFTPTTSASFKVGLPIAVSIAGHIEIAWVTNVAAGDVTVTPAFSRTLINGDIVMFGDMLYQDDTLSRGASVALRMQTTEGICYAFGCRATKIELASEQRQAVATITLKAAHIRDDRSGSPAPVAVDYADGALPHLIGSYAIYGGVVDNTAAPPAASSRTVMAIEPDSFKCTVENAMAPTGYTGSILESAEYEATDVKVDMEFVLRTPATDLDAMLWQRQARGMFVNFGPCGPGNGIGIAMFAASATADASKREFTDGLVMQKVMVRTGEFKGDTSSLDGGNTPFRIAIIGYQPPVT
jgi:hypothetical protein